ncbi:MAG: mucoidy inhibitor MuiA family protein [Candidatus Thorarchaeota archaeon]
MMSKIIDTRIAAVTVFRDGARITRVGKTKVSAGDQTVIVEGITMYAQQDSFRVKGKGAASLKGIDVRQVTQTFEPEGDLREMREQLKELEKEREVLASVMNTQQSRAQQYEAVMSQFSNEFGKWFAVGESSLEKLMDIEKVVTKQVADAKKKFRDVQIELDELNARIQSLTNNINRVQGQRRTETHYMVHVLLSVRDATEIELEVTYQIAYAGWHPVYDVDLMKDKSSLKRIAMVRNNSLEDWDDVSLTVSTASAKPVKAVDATPYYIDTFTPSIGRLASSSTGYADDYGAAPAELAMDKEYEEVFEPEPIPDLKQTYADVSETISGIVVYDVPGRVTIASDEDPHPVTLLLEEFESRQLHFWNAYAMPEVVAQDEITNGNSVLLPGNVKVYSEGDFIGETSIAIISPREKFRLGTRTAYDVKAEKKLVTKETDKAGFTKGKTRRGYRYMLKLESFSKDPIEIRVVDRIPHSTSERIIIEMKEPSHVPSKSELGVLEWELSLEPNSKAEITYEFDAEWEKEISITPPLP